MKNKTKIKCTAINTNYPINIFCDKFLLLRTIRKVGDIEIVNNTQLGKCKNAKTQNTFDFIILK